MRRNRQQRKSISVYRLDSLFRKKPGDTPLSEAQLQIAPPHYLEGEIENTIFVSVPMTTTINSCERLRSMLQVALQETGKQVVILTHNIEVLKATRLPRKVAAQVLRNIEDSVEGKADGRDNGSRSGPRLRESGIGCLDDGHEKESDLAEVGESGVDRETGGEEEEGPTGFG